MIRILFWSIIFMAAFLSGRAMGQELGDHLLASPSWAEIQNFFAMVRGVKGLSWFVAALISVQGLFLLFRTVVGEVLGVHRLLVLAILSVGATISVNILGGKGVVESIMFDSATLMAYQVLFHQIKRQWEKRVDDRQKVLPKPIFDFSKLWPKKPQE